VDLVPSCKCFLVIWDFKIYMFYVLQVFCVFMHVSFAHDLVLCCILCFGLRFLLQVNYIFWITKSHVSCLCYTSVNPVHNAPHRSPHPVLCISPSGSLPPIKTPRTPPPPPPPLHEKNKNHDPPKPLAQKKRTQISSPTLQVPKIPPPSTTAVVARKRT
jgi:hypothetical protein